MGDKALHHKGAKDREGKTTVLSRCSQHGVEWGDMGWNGVKPGGGYPPIELKSPGNGENFLGRRFAQIYPRSEVRKAGPSLPFGMTKGYRNGNFGELIF